MRLAAAMILAGLLCSCSLFSQGSISLSSSEKAQVMAIALQRQQLSIKQQKAQAAYQEETDRINEQVNELNVQSNALCFEFKKNHHLDPSKVYRLDEFNGVLVQQ